jgi:ankyrin repeat protein
MHGHFERLIDQSYEKFKSIEFDSNKLQEICILQAGEMLLLENLDVNDMGTDNQTPLMSLSAIGDIELVKRFIAVGADANILDDLNSYALLESAINSHRSVFDFLLPLTNPKLRKLPIDIINNNEDRFLRENNLEERIALENFIRYASKGEINRLKKSFHTIASINDIGADGQSALHKAVISGKISAVTTLLEMGAYPRNKNYQQKSPIDIAKEYSTNNREIFDCLKKANILFEDLLEEAFCEFREMDINGEALWIEIVRSSSVKFLNENANPNLNEKIKGGYTPLIFLSHIGELDLTKEFLNLGADANILDDLNGYALLEAANQGHQHIFDYLLGKVQRRVTEG